ncbi:hypothetical protein GCM10009715_39840 [Paeniglutamicibacter psychrophenolicus]
MAKYGMSGAMAPATKAIGTKGWRRKGRTAAGWARVKGKMILEKLRQSPRGNELKLRMGPPSSLVGSGFECGRWDCCNRHV